MPNRMEEMASKAMGKAKEGKAAATGLTGVFRTLAEQHGEVSALLKRAKSSDDPARRTELWQKIRVELLSHERAEMREVYPVLREYAETRTLAEHHDREAKELESMISRLDGTDHLTHRVQASMIRRYIIWRNRHRDDVRLRRIVARAKAV